MAEGSNRLAARKRRIERAPAQADEVPKGHESTLDNLAPGPARRRGRPALPPEEGKRYPLGIRTTKALRDALLSASRASGRSLAQEIEFRLEHSFRIDAVEETIGARIGEINIILLSLHSELGAAMEEVRKDVRELETSLHEDRRRPSEHKT